MALSYTKFQCFVEDLGLKVHNLDTDDIGLALTNTLPSAANDTVLANITEIGTGTGYSAGGPTIANTAYGQASGVGKLVGDDITITASEGGVGPFRYLVLYNKTAAGNPLIGFWSRAAPLTLADGESYLIDFHATNGILQLT